MLKSKKTAMLMVFTLLFCLLAVGAASATDAPSANFTSNVTNGTGPLSVQFNDTSTGSPTSWSWDFGDNSTSTEQNPVHNYNKAGNYSVSLTAINEVGNNTITRNNYITVLLNDVYISPTGNDTTGDGTSTNPYSTIQNGLTYVSNGGTIHLLAGTYTGTGNKGLTITKDVTIVGDAQNTTIINAESSSNIFNVNSGVNIAIKNLTFANGTASNGSAIYNRGTLNVSNCTFTGNTATGGSSYCGGAIYNSGTLNVSDCTFTGNTAPSSSTYCGGSGIYNNAGTVTISNCTFTGNTVTGGTKAGCGGAVYNNAGTITIIDCTFTNNTGRYAGAIVNYKGTITALSGCTFTNNTGYNGGALYISSATITNISGCTFTNNTATSSGGAISNGGTITNMNGCTFTNNTATSNGGAIYNSGTITNMNGCTFTNNTATSNGGAIYYGTITNMSGCTFTGNTANSGGAIALTYSSSSITAHYNSFVNNTATTGSAIYRSAGTVNAQYNWWGSNSSPSSQIYSSGSLGTINYSNWLYMTMTVVPSNIANGSTGIVTVSFNNAYNGTNANSIDPESGHIPDGTTVTFSSVLGTFDPVTALTTNGTAITTFTATDTSVRAINAKTDSQTVSTYINGIATTISAANVTGLSGSTVNLTATLTSLNGTGLSGKTVTFTVNGTSYNTTTDANGVATLSYDLGKAGVYSLTASFAGDTNYGDSTNNGNNYLNIQLNDVYVSSTGNDTTGDGTPTNPFATIQYGLTCVTDGGTLHLLAGTYNGTGNVGLTINKNVNIVGESQLTTIIDAQSSSNLLTINSGINVAITNLKFTNAQSSNGGAAIYNNGALSVINCNFISNTATPYSQGGAIYNTGTLNLTNCAFTSNTAKSWGGAIYNTGTLNANNCAFTSNTAGPSYGGAIYNTGTLNLTNCAFTSNTAGCGAAIYNTGTLNTTNCAFRSNTATPYYTGDSTFGGAIYNTGTSTVHFSSFVNNTANSGGNSIYRSSGTVNAEYNWWGSNSSPVSQVYGTVDYSNWLYMTLTVNPTTIVNGSTATVTVNFNNIWNGTDVVSIDPASGHISDGTVVTFTSALGTFDPLTVTTTNGTATTTFTATATGIGVINATAGSTPVSGNVTVYDVPVADFTVNATSGMSQFTVQFTDTSINVPSSWAWDFDGDGVIDSTSQNPTWIYTTDGTYTVTLTATNILGNNTITKTDLIKVGNPELVTSNLELPVNPITGTNYTINTTVTNTGVSDAGSFVAKIYDNNIQVAKTTITSLAAGANTILHFNWTPTTAGSHILSVIADVNKQINETNRNNNQITQTITAITASLPELTVSNLQLPTNPVNGTTYTINVTVANTGNDAAGSFIVKLYDNNVQIGKIVVNGLAAGTSTILNFNWTPNTIGTHVLSVIADTNKQINETNRNNNQITQTVNTTASTLPDLTVSNLELPANPVVGTTYTINVTIANTGASDITNNFAVKLYDNNTQIQKITVTNLAAGTNTILSFNWTPTTTGTHNLSVIADTNKQLTETTRNNNQITQAVTAT